MNKANKLTPRDRIEQRETDILSAAGSLFAELGFNATTTKKIATQAGVSEGTVFHYFATKHDILSAILGSLYAELTQAATEGLEQHSETKDRILFIAENHVRGTAGNNALLLRLVYVYMNSDLHLFEHLQTTDLYKLNQTYTKIFDTVILDGIRHDAIRDDINLSAIRDLFFGGLEYGMRTLMLRNKMDAIEDYVRDIVSPLWESIRKKPVSEFTGASLSHHERLDLACKRIENLAEKLESK